MQWQDKLAAKIMRCPYQHIVFTIPHEMNYIAVRYPKLVYNTLFKSAWKTIHSLSKDEENVGGTPGMTAVLHTFGSDLKHHIHLHTLVPFGAIDKDRKWIWPKRKDKIASYRAICKVFRSEYLKQMHKVLKAEDEEYYETVVSRLKDIEGIRWCVHNTPPTTHTKVIEEYLSRYICRVGVSDKKLKYDPLKQEVKLQYNDYRKQEKNQAAPKAYKQIDPLIAIDQILKHVLPPYFQKVRYFGIMTSNQLKKIRKELPELVKENRNTIRTLFQIVKALLQIEDAEEIVCQNCGSADLKTQTLIPDSNWYEVHIRKNKNTIKNKSPDQTTQNIMIPKILKHHSEPSPAMLLSQEISLKNELFTNIG